MENTTANTATVKSGMSTTKKVLIGTAIGLGALFVIGSIMPKSATTDTTPEPVAVVETPIETKVEWEPAVEPETDDSWINEAAANITWSNTDPAERQAICNLYNANAEWAEDMARDLWNGQGLEVDLQNEMILLWRETC